MSSAIETLLETRPTRAVQQINRAIPEDIEIQSRGEELLHARRITLARDFTLWNINQDGEQHWTSRTLGETVRMSKNFRTIRDAWDYCDLALPSNTVVDWYAGDLLVGGFVTLPPSSAENRQPETDSREQAVSMFDHIEAPMWVSSTAGHGIKLVSTAEQLEPAFETVIAALPSVSKPAKQLLKELPRPLPAITDELDGGGRVTCWPGTAVIWQAMAEMSSGDLPGTRYPHSPVNDYLAAARVWGRAAERAAVQIWEGQDLADVHRLIQEFVLKVADKEAFAINYSSRDAELEGFVSGPVRGVRAKRKAERWSQSLRRDEEFWKATP